MWRQECLVHRCRLFELFFVSNSIDSPNFNLNLFGSKKEQSQLVHCRVIHIDTIEPKKNPHKPSYADQY